MALPLSYNVRSIGGRWQVTLLAVGGIALVVAVLLVLTAMANGFRVALRATGSPLNAIVTQRGSSSELTSGFSRDNASTIVVDSRVARDGDGKAAGVPGDRRRREPAANDRRRRRQRDRPRRLADGVQ